MSRQYNEKGFAFEINRDLTKYAQEEQLKVGFTLPSLGKDIIVLNVFDKGDNLVSQILYDQSSKNIIDEANGIEAMAVCIDKHKLAKTF